MEKYISLPSNFSWCIFI